MIPVFICENDPKKREQIKKIIEDYILIEEIEMELISAENPKVVLDFLEENVPKNGVYVLDFNLGHNMNGVTLAAKIREVDTEGTIIFVTDHPELMYLVFTYKLEVMDFIIKTQYSEMETRIRECLQLVYKRVLRKQKANQKFYQVKVAGKIKMIPYEEIMFIETSLTPHMLILHLTDDQIEFRGSIKEVANNEKFFRCHKSAIVNIQNVIAIDTVERLLELVNGSFCPVSVKALKDLKNHPKKPLITNSA